MLLLLLCYPCDRSTLNHITLTPRLKACHRHHHSPAAAAGRLRGRTAVALQTVAELSLFLGMVAYARSGG